jgi:hypothetical protein
MPTRSREKLETRVDGEILSAVRAIARSEGRELQTLVNEALVDLVKKRNQGRPRAHVISAYEASHDEFAPLYKKLAE